MTKRIFLYCLAAVSAVVMLLSAGGCGHKAPEGPSDAELMAERVRGVEKLVLGQMAITKTATIDDLKVDEAKGARQMVDAVINALKIGDRKAVYSYDTYLQAYIDLSTFSAADVSIDEENKRATITLPQVQVEFAGRDAGIREDHYRVTRLRSQIKPEERAAVKERMNAHLLEEVRRDDGFKRTLADNARKNAEKYFKDFFAAYGYDATVNFK